MSILSLDTGTIAHFMPEGADVQAAVNLNALADVTLVTLTNGQILQYNSSSGQWENIDPQAIQPTLIDGGTY